MNNPALLFATRSSSPRHPRSTLLVLASAACLSIALPPSPAAAQQPAAAPRADSTRSAARVELERRAAALEASGKRQEALAIRRRLAEGDFPVGDRIVLTVTGGLVVNDTLPIRAGQLLTVPSLPDISMRGVLRPELNDYLTSQISRYVRDPVVHSSSLVRVAVTGAVGRPGFYAMPADILLGDAIMRAGGPTGESDMSRTVVRRGKSEVLSKGAVQTAVRDGTTLDQAGLRAGDEIIVGKKRNFNWTSVLLVSASVLGSVLALASFLNR